MDIEFIKNRITELRINKGVSEYKMSLDLGHSKSYVQSISSGRALPSMVEFLYICEYLGISPKDFFDNDVAAPALINTLLSVAKTLNEDDLRLLLSIAQRLSESTDTQS